MFRALLPEGLAKMTACTGRESHASVSVNLPSCMTTVSVLLLAFSLEAVGIGALSTSSVSLSIPVSVPLIVVPFCAGWQAQSSAAPANSVNTFFFIGLYRFN